LVSPDAPTRAILCAGAGHFARANITLTNGIQIGAVADAADRVASHWHAIDARQGEIVPGYGFKQLECELEAAGLG